MEFPTLNTSVLEKHKVVLDDKLRTNVIFYSYYNNKTPIYYELSPIIKVFKFTKEQDTIALIPTYWIKKVADFNDPIFASKDLLPDALFIEASGISFLIASSENKSLAGAVTNLYNMCIRKTENDRVKRINTAILYLKQKIASLEDDLDRKTKQFSLELNELTHKHEKHSKQTELIKDVIQVISENHSIIQDAWKSLCEKL